MRFLIHVITCVLVLSGTSFADTTAILERYSKALNMPEVYELLRLEGIQAGQDVTREQDGVTASPAWTARLNAIYAVDKMKAAFEHGMATVPDLESSNKALQFFESELGKRIVQIEIDARRALNDDAVEDGVRDQVKRMRDSDPDRIALYDKFIVANDLVESNVAGALNSNMAFYRGLATSDDYKDAMNESFILSTVMEQEAEIRKDTKDWVINFSALAYSPLKEDEMEDYIDISNDPAGQKLNAVLFAGFDKMFEMQSFELGRAMAEFMVGEDT